MNATYGQITLAGMHAKHYLAAREHRVWRFTNFRLRSQTEEWM